MTNKTLLKAILSMDSYSRGYGEKIPDLLSSEGTKVGNARIGIQSDIDKDGSAVKASFYAISYSYNGETIISYRGTDVISIDAPTGWTTGAGSYSSPQAKLAAEFYNSVIGDANPYNVNVTFTGHSLGGGLAGFIASLYSKEATIFDNMPFEAAAYDYNKGSGSIIIDAANANLVDRIVFGSGISLDDLTFSSVGV